jgi:2-oxo-3-hexenedioate decarboxylase
MTLDDATVARLAALLDEAERERRAVPKITDQYPGMDWQDAYEIQYAVRARKEARGVRIAGLKMGLTSQAKMQQMGVSEPVFGFLTDYGRCTEGSVVDTGRFIHPRIEAEIALVTRRVLAGPGCHLATALAAIELVLPAVEIIDSRYEAFRFDLKSVIADNTSAAAYAVGEHKVRPEALDLPTLGVVMEKNGEIVQTGAGAAVMGHPAASLAALANMLASRGEHVPAGTLVLTGGITAAVGVAAGDHVLVRYQGLGTLGLSFG